MQRIILLQKHFPDIRGPHLLPRPPPLLNSYDEYKDLYDLSINDPNNFWATLAESYHWDQKWADPHTWSNMDIRQGPVSTYWFKGGRTNICYNCLDRHVLNGRGNQVCFIWEGNNLGHERTMTYQQALDRVCQVANWLRGVGVRKGDTVTLYLPMICELPLVMLACARIGAVHSVVFAGFSAQALASRIQDCGSRVVVTASAVLRGTKLVELKAITDEAVKLCSEEGFKVEHVLVWEKGALPRERTPWTPGRDVWWWQAVTPQPLVCAPESMDSEDPLFMLYTSGSTGKPKGVIHTTGGYMVAAGTSSRYVFDIQPGDVYWASADCGWITGHTYVVYGPLLCAATVVLFGSMPTHPDPGRCWSIIEKYRVQTFYTSPTLVRSLLQHGNHWVEKYDRSSLRLLASAGEPINQSAWEWMYEVVGERRCPVIDTWWQTETGTVCMTTFPGFWRPEKPGCAGLPFFGIKPCLLDDKGNMKQGPGEGLLALASTWPSMARTLRGDHKRFEDTYFRLYPGFYFTGDGCRLDTDGHWWITGRVDDVINVSGHRIGSAEVENALSSHHECAEAAVIGVDHPVKGQAVYAYVTLTESAKPSEAMKKTLLGHVRQSIGPFAVPDFIHWAPSGLPKTRSGKIMRRVLRKIATKEESDLGDVSTLADPGVVDTLISSRGV